MAQTTATVAPLKTRTARLRKDRAARVAVTTGGLTIIACILAILVVIIAETLPLFQKARLVSAASISASPGPSLRTATDEYRELALSVSESGLSVFRIADGSRINLQRPLELGGARISAVSQGTGPSFAVGLSNGKLFEAGVHFSASFAKDRRDVKANLETGEPIQILEDKPVDLIAYAAHDGGSVIGVRRDGHHIRIVRIEKTESMMGDVSQSATMTDAEISTAGNLSALAVDNRGEHIFAGTSGGELVVLDIRDPEHAVVAAPVKQVTPDGSAVSALGFLIGDRTLVVGSQSGAVSTWQLLQHGPSDQFVQINNFAPHPARVIAIAASQRNKGFATLDDQGHIKVHYGTTGRTLLQFDAPGSMSSLAFAPKSDGLIAGGADGTLRTWTLTNPHPEVTWKTLFGKVWYEGYDKPAFVWQSTGGTDDFEAKFSLTPLIYGTMKGTFYALLFAIPVALLSALYASQFMRPSLRNIIKPVIEIMAALPSVVLGFIAGLWLAPIMEKIVPGIVILPLVTGACILLALFVWHRLPEFIRIHVKGGNEIFLLLPVVVLGGWLALRVGHVVEHHLLSGDYRSWLKQVLGLTFDQRNSMVVGFAMGFAVVPIIFTIAEDALSSVPNHLKAASLALGATSWQTAIRVVLPTASPGIFSAIMIGFGRAVGETMIVLMATGNTPVMDWSIFNGFRALSANIAVELPEAPDGGTLFRILFLAALLLFGLTFVVNTLAELIRLRLRQRYRVL